MHAFINAAAPWLNEHLKRFIREHVHDVVFVDDFEDFPTDAETVFQYCDGWALNQNFAVINTAAKGLINAYPNSDALARKDYLAAVVEYWTTKRSESILRKHAPQTVRLTLDYAEYVDEALMAADDLSLLYSLEKNADMEPADREWWILKPALVDCGAGIRLFSTVDELASHLELAENETDDDEEKEEEESSTEGPDTETETPPSTNPKSSPSSPPSPIPASPPWTPSLPPSPLHILPTPKLQAPPLRAKKPQYIFTAGGRILRPNARLRRSGTCAYALAVGRLKVHVFRDMLALLAAEKYQPPWENPPLRRR
ncbi:hypothetical protein N0V88_006897 [Collariella sp. IMI 366227]|nr:hypothetical protein N0V88_006897 [Collariella sp. IMI 366227]